jgi:hypothetical protein
MENSRLDHLEQQLVNLMTMFEGCIKKMEENNAKFDTFLSKKLLDAQKNKEGIVQSLLQPVTSPANQNR